MRIFLGLLMVIIGGIITIYANKIYESLGAMPWAEEHLGTEGGTRLMYKLLGIGLSIMGFGVVTGLLQNMALGFFRLIFGSFVPI